VFNLKWKNREVKRGAFTKGIEGGITEYRGPGKGKYHGLVENHRRKGKKKKEMNGWVKLGTDSN